MDQCHQDTGQVFPPFTGICRHEVWISGNQVSVWHSDYSACDQKYDVSNSGWGHCCCALWAMHHTVNLTLQWSRWLSCNQDQSSLHHTGENKSYGLDSIQICHWLVWFTTKFKWQPTFISSKNNKVSVAITSISFSNFLPTKKATLEFIVKLKA